MAWVAGDHGAAEQGPQRRPLGVPGAVGALVDGSAAARCRVAASWGVVSAARRTSAERTGLALCGMVDDPPPAPSDSSPTSGRPRARTSPAIRPQASVQVTAASPSRVTVARDVCHGGDAREPEALGG